MEAKTSGYKFKEEDISLITDSKPLQPTGNYSISQKVILPWRKDQTPPHVNGQ